MRVLGIDFGDRNVGLAVSDRLQFTALPLGTYILRSETEDAGYFKDLVLKHEISEIVIGFPLRMDGSEGTRVRKTREFASWLEKTLNLPIVFWDERLTTQQAVGIMHRQKVRAKARKKIKDQISASIILLSYLESRRVNENAPENH